MSSKLIENTKEEKKIVKSIFRRYGIIITSHAIDRLFMRCQFLSNIDIDILADTLSGSIHNRVKNKGVEKVFTRKYKKMRKGKTSERECICYTTIVIINGIQFVVAYEVDTKNYVVLTIIVKGRTSKAL